MDISFQLYSSRNAPSQVGVLSMLADLGYTQVEGFGGVYGAPSEFRDAMAEAGVTMPSGHFGVAELENDFVASLNTARTLGVRHVIAPYLDEQSRPTDTDGYKAFAARLAELHTKVTGEGFSFSWHNHDFEFAPLPDGTIPMQLLLEEVGDLTWEADLAWVVRGGEDPEGWLKRYAERVIAIHVKDIAPVGQNADEDGWADVGQGTIDWGGLTKCARHVAPEALMIMEHDNPSDVARFAANSIQAFKSF